MSTFLLSPWSLWACSILPRSKPQSYEGDLVLISDFHTLDQFFHVFAFTKPISELRPHESYSLFRKGLKPMWESAPAGGCWILKRPRKVPDQADLLWETLVLECIRGQFSRDISGIMVTAKRFEFVIQVWMHEAAAVHLAVAEEIKAALQVSTLEMHFKYHKDSLKDMSTVKSAVKIVC
jgi:hypothetical protein